MVLFGAKSKERKMDFVHWSVSAKASYRPVSVFKKHFLKTGYSIMVVYALWECVAPVRFWVSRLKVKTF